MKDRIRKLRKMLDLTQQDFAKKIGMSANVLTNYETGRRNPSKSVINNICKTFHVNEEWLRDGAGEMFADVSRDEQITEFVQQTLASKPNSFQRRFAAMLSTLSDSDWEVLERMAYAIIEERDSAAPTPAEPEKPAAVKGWKPMTDEEIEAELEDYRKELLAEREAAERSSALPKADGA